MSDEWVLGSLLCPQSSILSPGSATLVEKLRSGRFVVSVEVDPPRGLNPAKMLQGAALLPLQQIPAFVNATQPLTRDLPTLGRKLKVEVPDTISAFKVLAYATNEIAYNPGGNNPGFLYWLAWFAHNSASFISSSDANGPVWRSIFVTSCRGLSTLSAGPILEQVLGTTFGCS